MAGKAKHAYGSRKNLEAAIASGAVDAFDVLFLNDDGESPAIGWIDKDGNPIIVEGGSGGGSVKEILRVTELPTENGSENVVYIYNNEGYIWSSTENKCVPLSKSADLTSLKTQVSEIESQLGTKIDEATVDAKIEAAIGGSIVGEIIEF